ncbi:MAG: hypothetical protein ACI9EF_003844 [Pseudohongiellaceae bacterium]|jgi:hypothetical protein
MTELRITLHGESWLAIETVAEVFSCEVTLVRAVYDRGLLGPGEQVGQALFVRCALLDRVARIVRLSVHQGFELETIEALLALEG